MSCDHIYKRKKQKPIKPSSTEIPQTPFSAQEMMNTQSVKSPFIAKA
jgi:hypothetical protein